MGIIGGEKTEEDFGAVNDFPSSQGRLQVPMFAPAWRREEVMLPARACLRRRVPAPASPPSPSLPPGALELPAAVGPGWIETKMGLRPPKRGCTGSSLRDLADGDLNSPGPGSAAWLSVVNFKHLRAGGERQG